MNTYTCILHLITIQNIKNAMPLFSLQNKQNTVTKSTNNNNWNSDFKLVSVPATLFFFVKFFHREIWYPLNPQQSEGESLPVSPSNLVKALVADNEL